jgi:hypothetical protein
VITFAGIRSRIAAEGIIVSARRVAGVYAILKRAQGGASPAEFIRPMSRRKNTQQRKFSLPPRGTGTHADRHQQCSNTCDLSLQREPDHPEMPASCAIAELRCGARKSRPGSAVEQSAALDAELVDAHGLLASLVWHRVRPPNPSGAETGPRRPSRSDLESLGKRRSVRPVTTAQTPSVEPSPASIEALFSHLARRRLRSLAQRRSSDDLIEDSKCPL